MLFKHDRLTQKNVYTKWVDYEHPSSPSIELKKFLYSSATVACSIYFHLAANHEWIFHSNVQQIRIMRVCCQTVHILHVFSSNCAFPIDCLIFYWSILEIKDTIQWQYSKSKEKYVLALSVRMSIAIYCSSGDTLNFTNILFKYNV